MRTIAWLVIGGFLLGTGCSSAESSDSDNATGGSLSEDSSGGSHSGGDNTGGHSGGSAEGVDGFWHPG